MNRLSYKILRCNLKRYGIGCSFTRTQSNTVEKKMHEKDDGVPVEEIPSTKNTNTKISTKVEKKLPAREPLLKNFFIGKVDNKLLSFPEVIPREDMSKLQEEIGDVRKYFLENSVTTQCMDQELEEKLRKLGVFGHNISQDFGGNGYLSTEGLIAAEPATLSADISHILSSHYLVADVLQKFGNDNQKEQFLPHLANGSVIATEAIYEYSVPEKEFFSTKAEFDDLENQWIINGEKCFVVNGKQAELYLVLAQTNSLNIAGDIAPGVTLFLVDASSPGIKQDKQIVFGCKGSDYSSVKFENVTVPECSVVGAVNEGTNLVEYFLKFQRLRMSLLHLGLIKKTINNMAQHCITEKLGPIFLKDMDIIERQISELLCKAYALESMIYYTAGLVDEFDNQDVIMEVAVTKLFSIDSLWATATSPMNFMGPSSLLSGNDIETNLRDAAQLYMHSEPRNSLCLYAGLLGLQYAGINTNEIIQKERNPLFHPRYIFRKMLQRESIENPKLKWQLDEDLHPTLHTASQWLELSIARMQMASEILLTRYGNEVVEKHTEIKRMAEMASLIYSMFTSLSRASRSYCIGLKFADYEILLASTICNHAKEQVKTLATEISHGPFVNNDKNHNKISKQIFKSRGYFLDHPTAYNF